MTPEITYNTIETKDEAGILIKTEVQGPKSFYMVKDDDEFITKLPPDCEGNLYCEIKFPEMTSVERYERNLRQLEYMKFLCEKARDNEIKESENKIKKDYQSKLKFYDKNIKKWDSLLFLEKQYGIKPST
jgi:hydroxymethylpyrimidine pyrophosphatase-like HAD family hydrolase